MFWPSFQVITNQSNDIVYRDHESSINIIKKSKFLTQTFCIRQQPPIINCHKPMPENKSAYWAIKYKAKNIQIMHAAFYTIQSITKENDFRI